LEIIYSLNFVSIGFVVVYCATFLEENDIFITCYTNDWCTCHHSK